MKRGTPDHPKLYALAEALKIRRPVAVGYLELLFHFTAQYCPRGDIGRYDDKRIAAGLDWCGKPALLVDALVATGWLDRDEVVRLVVHDWHDHADRVTLQRLSRSGKSPVQPVQQFTDETCTQSETPIHPFLANTNTYPIQASPVPPTPPVAASPELPPKPAPRPKTDKAIAAMWRAAEFEDAEHFERWFHELYARHPTKGDPGFAKNYLHEAIVEGKFTREQAEASYQGYRQSAAWQRDRGKIIPKLSTLCRDRFWLYPPTEVEEERGEF